MPQVHLQPDQQLVEPQGDEPATVSFTSVLYLGHGKQSSRADGVLSFPLACPRPQSIMLKGGCAPHRSPTAHVGPHLCHGKGQVQVQQDCGHGGIHVEGRPAEHRTGVRVPSAGDGLSRFQHPSAACKASIVRVGPATSRALAPSLSAAADDLPTSLAQTPRKVVSRCWRFELRPSELAAEFSLCLGWLRSLSASLQQPQMYICNVLWSLYVGACVFTYECV